MSIITGLVSYVIVAFLVLPFLDSFAYTKKNVLLHGLFGALLAFIHSQLGFVGLIENLLYVLLLHYSKKYSLQALRKNSPAMNDLHGHAVVNNANRVLIVIYLVVYALLNVRFG